MWEGKVTEELKDLFQQYHKRWPGAYPDSYDELCYETMTYEQIVHFTKEALKQGKELPYVVP